MGTYTFVGGARYSYGKRVGLDVNEGLSRATMDE